MFEVDLGNSDSLSPAHYFRSAHCVNIRIQQDSLAAPVLSGRPSSNFTGTAKFFHQGPNTVYIFNGGRRKVDRKVTSTGRIS